MFDPINIPADADTADECPSCGGHKTIYALSTDPYRAALNIWELQPCPSCQVICQVCGNLGWVRGDYPVDHPDFGKAIPCPANCPAALEMAAESRVRRVRYSRLSDEYKDLTLDSFAALPGELLIGKMVGYWASVEFINAVNRSRMVDLAKIAARFDRSIAADLRNWLVFYGEHGRGKTGLAAAILNALVEQGEKPRYIRLQDFIEAIQKRYNKRKMERDGGFNDDFGDDTAEEVMEQFSTASILIIDEADVPDIRENKVALFERLIRYRHGEKLPTILTTNLDDDGFERRWGPTIATIVKSRAHWIPMRGLSLRKDAVDLDWELTS